MDKGTLVRTVALAIVWVNAILANYELQPIPVLEEEAIALGLAFITSIWTWFRNNYITLKGKKQRRVLKERGLTK